MNANKPLQDRWTRADGVSNRTSKRDGDRLPITELNDANEKHQGSRARKRARYIAKACNECKRRKIKCNGQKPCYGCGQRSIECTYLSPPDIGGKQSQTSLDQDVQRLYSQINALREHVDSLEGTLTTLTNQRQSVSASSKYSLDAQSVPTKMSTVQNESRQFSSPGWSFSVIKKASFQGPMTSAFSFDVAKSSLKSRGITEYDNNITDREATQEPSPRPTSSNSVARSVENASDNDVDPMWSISKEEACKLCHVYEEEIGLMYPVISLEDTLKHVDAVYRLIETAFPHGEAHPERPDISDCHDAALLKMVFASALTAQEGGHSDLALRLFTSVAPTAQRYIWGSSNVPAVLFLILVATFYFQMDEEALAWRIMGIVARMCLELGLHRSETLCEPKIIAFGPERVIKIFWSVYVLDMRWSLGTGMRCALQDIDIDPQLPQPDQSTSYLQVMVDYSRIAARVWNFVANFNNTNEIKKDEMAYLDWQVLQWADSIPKPLRLIEGRDAEDGEKAGRGIQRLRSILYLRTSQMRILIYRPILHSAIHMSRNVKDTDTVVEIAIDTIRYITHLHRTSDIYKLQQIAFNWFLVSALAVLFLAVAQAPSQYSGRCREKFYMALELVKSFSTQSYVSKRLWRSIRSLKMLAPKVGMHKGRDNTGPEANLAPRMYPAQGTDLPDESLDAGMRQNAHGEFPLYGTEMSQELVDWFEAVGDLANPLWLNNMPDISNTTTAPPISLSTDGYHSLTYGEGLSSIMKDCF